MESLLLTGGGVVVLIAVIGLAFWWVRRDAARAAVSEAQARSEAFARKAEEAMDSELLKREDPDETRRRADDGTF